ncbi:MAG: carbamoyltransferase [Clostridia bacterium]|nr:carbamoyltransferase [Clostridia bacterium]
MSNTLKDGYYLSVYSDIDPLLNVMQFSLRHDHNISLFKKNGNNIALVHHWELERITGFKHHNKSFFSTDDAINFINDLLRKYSISVDDLQGIIGTPLLDTCNDYHSLEKHSHISYHAISHLFTSMLIDSNEFYNNNIISLAFDGGPDSVVDKDASNKFHFCGAVSVKGNMELFPILSPGPYWAIASDYFGMPEGTLMALAYATEVCSRDTFNDLPDYLGSKDKNKCTQALMQIIEQIFSYTHEDNGLRFDNYDERFSEKENKISMVMKILQEMSINKIHKLVNEILKKYELDPKDTIITLSGGYALNCPTNTNIMHHYNFKKQLCCPCVNDGGLAIGMGLYYFYHKMDRINYTFETAFYADEDCYSLENILNQYNDFIKSTYDGIDFVAEDIYNSPIVWFYGRAEVGPRALGHRSILANPCDMHFKDLVNHYKQREWWRPVAPIILEEKLNDWFLDAFLSPYMLNNFVVKSDKKEFIPAVLHMDDTARVQTVNSTNDDIMYNVISSFYKKTGVPIICNTSLNDKGEPIINRIEEALNFALRKNIKIIYINGTRVVLKNHENYSQKTPLNRNDSVFIKHLIDKTAILNTLNPFNLSLLELYIYKHNSTLHVYDITSSEDAENLKRIINKIKKFNSDINRLESIGFLP